MSDYISKEELKERFVFCKGLGRTSLEAVLKAMDNTPTIDEKEIIRKMVERVVDMLESIEIGGDCRHKCNHYDWTVGACNGECTDYVKSRAIKIIKEECGISERD